MIDPVLSFSVDRERRVLSGLLLTGVTGGAGEARGVGNGDADPAVLSYTAKRRLTGPAVSGERGREKQRRLTFCILFDQELHLPLYLPPVGGEALAHTFPWLHARFM